MNNLQEDMESSSNLLKNYSGNLINRGNSNEFGYLNPQLTQQLVNNNMVNQNPSIFGEANNQNNNQNGQLNSFQNLLDFKTKYSQELAMNSASKSALNTSTSNTETKNNAGNSNNNGETKPVGNSRFLKTFEKSTTNN